MAKVRLIDVGNMAGVSKSTVSQYLNGRYEYMSAETRERIRQAVETLEFTPDPIARSMRTDKSYTIGIMVKNITGVITSNVIRGIDDYCKDKNYNVLIYNTDYIEVIERKSIASLRSLKADGLIITSSGKVSSLLNKADQDDLPMIHIHREYDDLHVSTVHSDYKAGSYAAIEYLLGLHHTNIAIFTRDYNKLPSRISRIKGCRDALQDNGHSLKDENICVVESNEDIELQYKRLMALPKPPTVIFSLFSDVSIELLSYLNNHEINVPNDISVIGFDDLPLAHLMKTPLTVVNQSAYEIGQTAAKLLLKRIATPNDEIDYEKLPCNLIIRDSCSENLKA